MIFRIWAWRMNWYTNEYMHHRPHAPQPPNLSKPLLFELVSAEAQIQPGLTMLHCNCIIFLREIKFQCSWLRHFVLIIEYVEFSNKRWYANTFRKEDLEKMHLNYQVLNIYKKEKCSLRKILSACRMKRYWKRQRKCNSSYILIEINNTYFQDKYPRKCSLWPQKPASHLLA